MLSNVVKHFHDKIKKIQKISEKKKLRKLEAKKKLC